jgi:hypothetical protein
VSGDDLTRWSIRAALALLAAALILRPWVGRTAGPGVAARFAWGCWVASWLIYLAHVAFAFHHYHHWSHAEAVRHVEQRSGFGPGLFVSYLFTLLWTADVVWWAAAPASHARRPAWVGLALDGFVVFMAFNGTVVYETGVIRIAGIVATALLVLSVALAWRRAAA